MFASGNGRKLYLFLAFLLLVGTIAVGLGLRTNAAKGDEAPGSLESFAPSAAQTKEALESRNAKPILEETETDLHAAQTMPHQDLERDEALELAEAVFAPEIDSSGDIYDEFDPQKFLSDFAAVVPASSLPESREADAGSLASDHPNMPILVESTLPLRTENSSGQKEAVDLRLEHSEGELQSQNPLAEVGIPEQLGEGIAIGGAEVKITLAGSPDSRTATNAGGEFAFYPEVSEDSDLIVTPTAQGMETMVDLRSPEAPTETTYELALPPTARLEPSDQGGAEVVEGDRTTLVVMPPTAIDAAGNPVQSELTLSGDSLTVITSPNPSTAYPVLVDPVFVEEGWRWTLNHDSVWAWTPTATNWSALTPFASEAWWPAGQYPGLDLSSGREGPYWSNVGDHADWEYWVPRYLADLHGTPKEAPSTWVYQMYVEGPQFYGWGNTENYPALVIGLVDPTKGWQGNIGVHYGGNGDLNSWSQGYWYTNPTEQTGTKGADMDLVTYAEERPAKLRDTYMPDAYVSVVDGDAPSIGMLNPPEGWINGSPVAIPFEFQDRGLGVFAATLAYEGAALPGAIVPGGALNLSCAGTVAIPCPRIVKSGTAGAGELQTQLINYNPAALPTGKDLVTVRAFDPLSTSAGHVAVGTVLLKVDHTGPEVSLSGSMSEQSSLGTRRPSYSLRVNAKDGVSGAPQSGVKKVEIKVDGTTVPMSEPAEWEPKCLTENCSVSDEWTMNSFEYAAGAHEVKVIATDAAANVTTKILHVELNPAAPSLSLSGSLTEQGTLGTELPSYKLKINASALAESPTPAAIPAYSSSFGSSGTGNGQFAHPGSMAVDAQGNLWVVDPNNNRVQEFNEKGEYLRQFGTKGSANGQLSRPTAIAIAANGSLWVTDSGNKRVEEFTSTGTFMAKFGTAGTGSGQFADSGPEAVAIDYHGNIWVADTYGGRIEKFTESGAYVRSVGTKGKGPEQLLQPDGIAVAPGGNVFVTDWENDKVAEYGQGGAFIRQFASQGTEPGQLQNPTGIAIDDRGNIWIPDQNNGRVEEFDQAGNYLGRFGSKGTGAGQFELGYPTGIATDGKGDIWITDWGNNRVDKWVSPNYLSTISPTYMSSFGTTGTGAGHFTTLFGVATDAGGNIWTTDMGTNQVQRFTPAGGSLGLFGGPGTGNGQYKLPAGLTINSGHVWIADYENNRIEELNESGSFLSKFGELGTANGPYFHLPTDLAVDSAHHLWVSDAYNNRVEELSETGAFIRSVTSLGTGGTFNWPVSLAVGPGNKVWVTDYNNHRIVELSETGVILRAFGATAGEPGALSQPMGLAVDSRENVWVADRILNSVLEYNGKGEYMGRFGTTGTGAGALKYPEDVALDGKGHIFVADDENHRVEEWAIPTAHSQVSTEIMVDGKRVEAFEKGCETETCTVSGEWTLNSSSFTPGSHEVVVRATDGLGNTTSKTLTVKTGDATKPALEVGGALISAPEGWVQQEEGTYGLTASATDKGFGVTALRFKIDGKSATSNEQACPAGKCSASISASVNAKTLAAGAHEAEVIAVDGAGNSTQRKWTINVDPEGVISNEELVATAEALEGTSGSPILAEADEIPGVVGSTDGVGLTEGEEPESLRATGTYVPMNVSSEPEEGFELHVAGISALALACDEVENPEEEECVPRAALETAQAAEEQQVAEGLKYPGMTSITVKPVATGPTATEQELIGEQTAGSANAGGEESDTFTRPLSDGGLSFADIRGPAAPEHYAYELGLDPELQLRQPDPQHVEVVYWKYGVTAFVITAEQAHDVIGSTVPTHLSISGPAKVTLTVEHRGASPAGGGFAYPVLGGAGWQGGYFVASFEMNEPLPPAESAEEEEELEEEEVAVSSAGELVGVNIRGFGPQHVIYNGGTTPTPHSGWAVYIERECEWLTGEVEAGAGKTPTQPVGGKYVGISKGILDELIYHCHKTPNLQGGYLKPKFAVSVHGKYSWVWGEKAKLDSTPQCSVAGLFPPLEVGCGGPKGEVRAGGENPKVSAYNRVWFAKGTYRATIPFCAVLEIVLPSKPTLAGRHSLENELYKHWWLHEQGLNETAAQCPWEHF